MIIPIVYIVLHCVMSVLPIAGSYPICDFIAATNITQHVGTAWECAYRNSICLWDGIECTDNVVTAIDLSHKIVTGKC